jgi:uncharacterized membrane protein
MVNFLKKLFGGPSGSIVPGLFAVGSWFVSEFFKLPYNEPTFRAAAIVGMLAGYALGNVCCGSESVSEKLRLRHSKRVWVGVSVLGAGTLGIITMVDYYYYVRHVVEYSQLQRAALQLALVFACAGYLMPIAGIYFGQPEEEHKREAEPGSAKE